MALIERHPEVDDYILEMTLAEIRARGGRLIVRGARPEVAELLAVVGIPGAPHAEPASPARLDILAPVR